MQREATEQAEENWESLKAAEKSIFEDIAKGTSPPLLRCTSFLRTLACCFLASGYELLQV